MSRSLITRAGCPHLRDLDHPQTSGQGTSTVTYQASYVLGDAENPHLGGVHDLHEKSGISGVIVGAVSLSSARCRLRI
jgi:hypothetical protein